MWSKFCPWIQVFRLVNEFEILMWCCVKNLVKKYWILIKLWGWENRTLLFTGACRPRPGGLSAASARRVRTAPAAAPVPRSFLVWDFILSYNCSNLLILIQIHDFWQCSQGYRFAHQKGGKKATSKKKSKDVGASKRRRKDDSSEEE
jgi:hypothetical protein